MNLSLGEFQALVAKAFRGAGYPWGLTEDASYAARRLAEFGFPSGRMVVRLLSAVDDLEPGSLMPDESWQSPADLLCPICVGVSIADMGGCESISTGPLPEPAFIAPLLARTLAAESVDGYIVRWDGGTCAVTANSIRSAGEDPAHAAAVTITRQPIDFDIVETVARVELSVETYEALAQLAHRTYAPATEASRLAGAGAGTTDND